ncbi:MAG: SDR family NAD(P)-dependent oxidoreductase [Galbitalea sp.]
MDDRTVIVTGGNAGLGYETAKNIALSDPAYHVVLACRSRSRGEGAAASLRSETGNPRIQAMQLDLASLASVRAFATTLSEEGLPPLFGIVCNAGISAAGVAGTPRTEDGFEMIFGVNHLGHFLLTNLLLPAMEDHGRIVFVTSDLHNPPAFFPAKVRYDSGAAIAHGKAGMAQYCTSKLCNIYCTYEMARLIQEDTEKRITVNAFNPGAMSDTGFATPDRQCRSPAAQSASSAASWAHSSANKAPPPNPGQPSLPSSQAPRSRTRPVPTSTAAHQPNRHPCPTTTPTPKNSGTPVRP